MDTIDTYIAISEHVSQYGVFSLCFLNIMLVLGIFEMHVLITTLKTICQKSVELHLYNCNRDTLAIIF